MGNTPIASTAWKISQRHSKASSLKCWKCEGWMPSRLLDVFVVKAFDAALIIPGLGLSIVLRSGTQTCGASSVAFQ
eukprot:6699719-Pyramimonas_sp.AAC.1